MYNTICKYLMWW